MGIDLPYRPYWARRSASALLFSTLFLVSFAVRAQEKPAALAPQAPAATEATAPEPTAPPNAPQHPVPSPRTWPRALLWGATGALFLGIGLMTGSYVAAKTDQAWATTRTVPTLYTRGCVNTAVCTEEYREAMIHEATGDAFGEDALTKTVDPSVQLRSVGSTIVVVGERW